MMLVTAWFSQGCYLVTVTFSVGDAPIQANFKTLQEAAMFINSVIIEYGHEENLLACDDLSLGHDCIFSPKPFDNGDQN
jgi:hypothetical protein